MNEAYEAEIIKSSKSLLAWNVDQEDGAIGSCPVQETLRGPRGKFH